MSKNNKKQETKRNDPVGEYLVSRIKELEHIVTLQEKRISCLIAKNERYATLKSLFHVEKGEFVSIIVVRDLDNNYCGMFATENNPRFKEYLDLLGEKE